MFWGRTRNLTEGVLGDIRENGGLTAKSLREHVEKGATLLVPLDPRVSPWMAPKLFSLSHNQAMTLLDALDEGDLRISFTLRSDGTIALLRRDDADADHDGVPAGGA